MAKLEKQPTVLERYKFAILQAIPKEYVDTFDVNFSHEEGFEDDVYMRVMRLFYGYKLENYKIPVDWWQAFKERFFPKWIIKRFPIVYRNLTISALYPDIPNIKGHPPTVCVTSDYRDTQERW